MKQVILLAVVLLALVSCAPSEAELQEAVAVAIQATQDAQPTATAEPTVTNTPRPTYTSVPTDTPTPAPTNTPRPTSTPRPTATLFPTPPALVMDITRRCVDQITNDYYLYSDPHMNAVWARLSPVVTSVIIPVGESFVGELEYYYVADDWLFVDELIFNADGEVIRLTPEWTDTTVLSGGTILEAGGILIDLDGLNQLYELATGDNVQLRYSGTEGAEDVTLDEYEQNMMRFILAVLPPLLDGSISPDDFEEGCPG